MEIPLTLPDDLAAPLGGEDVASACAQADLAVHYYRERRVSLGRAAELSGMKRWEFEKLLAERGVVRDYSAEDLAKDLTWARTEG